jgi:ABC-type phosphate/phosphonate transport system ATPase subunit
MAGFFTWVWDWLLWMFWATEMDVTIVGLQNAGKTSLVRVLAVSRALSACRSCRCGTNELMSGQ